MDVYKTFCHPEGTLNAEVLGMLIGNFQENHKKYPDFNFKYLKIPKLLAQYPKKYRVSCPSIKNMLYINQGKKSVNLNNLITV